MTTYRVQLHDQAAILDRIDQLIGTRRSPIHGTVADGVYLGAHRDPQGDWDLWLTIRASEDDVIVPEFVACRNGLPEEEIRSHLHQELLPAQLDVARRRALLVDLVVEQAA